MTENDWKQFSTLIGETYGLYQRPPLGVKEMRMFFDALSDLPIEAVAEGVKRHMMACTGEAGRFAPKPADIRLALFGTPEQAACAAWPKVQKQIWKLKSCTSVQYDNPAYHYAIEACGGWVELCRMRPEEAEPLFRRYYATAIRERIGWSSVPDHFQGTDEINRGVLNPWTSDRLVHIKTWDFAPTSEQKQLKEKN